MSRILSLQNSYIEVLTPKFLEAFYTYYVIDHA